MKINTSQGVNFQMPPGGQFSRAVDSLQAAIELLAGDPRPPAAARLVGGGGEWRVRTGNYRIVYDIEDDQLLVLVLAVGHRRESTDGADPRSTTTASGAKCRVLRVARVARRAAAIPAIRASRISAVWPPRRGVAAIPAASEAAALVEGLDASFEVNGEKF